MRTMDHEEQVETTSVPPVHGRPSRRGHRIGADGKAALAIGLVLLGVYWITMGGHTYSVDGETYLAGTRALFHHTTVLTPGTDLDAVVIAVENKNGQLTTAAPIGTLLLFSPGFAAGKIVAAPFAVEHQEEIIRLVYLSANSAMTAITAMVLFFLCRRLGASRSSAVLLAIAYGLGTWAWAHAQTDFSEPGTALLLTSSLLASVHWWERRTTRAAALVGFLAGCTVLTRSSTMLFIPVLLMAGLVGHSVRVERQRVRQLAAFCCGGALPAVAFALNSWVRFGSPFDSGYPMMRFSTPIYEGVYGLFLSPGKGLLLYAPICIVVVFAVRTSALTHPRYAATVGGILVTHLLVYARFDIWSGENAYGPRYLVPVLPAIVALLAPVIDTGRQWVRGARVAAIAGFLIPGLLGSLMYFNAVYFAQQQQVAADFEVSSITTKQLHLVWNYYPRTSPLMLHIRSLPDLVRNTADRMSGEPGGITPFPAAYEERIHWHARAIELDTWWAWWPAKGGPGAVYILLLLPVSLLAAGVQLARRNWANEASPCPGSSAPSPDTQPA